MYVVYDKGRKLSFDGRKLAFSSSQRRGGTRWVEFELYQTVAGQYVLARTGVSLYFHKLGCSVVKRNNIDGVPSAEVPDNLVPCEMCTPIRGAEEVLFPETARYWAQVCTTPDCVIDSLYKYDDNDARYLTNVARSLLSQAAEHDDGIADAFFNEHID